MTRTGLVRHFARTGSVIVAIDDEPLTRAARIERVRFQSRNREEFKLTVSSAGVERTLVLGGKQTLTVW